MKLYKLTNRQGQTRNKTRWGEGVTHSGTGRGELCSAGYIHAYEHSFVAVFMNPIHANFSSPQLWEAKGDVARRDGELKCGCVSLTTTKQISPPIITKDQRTEIGIRCALFVYKEEPFATWASKWLSGADRTEKSAAAAVSAWEADKTLPLVSIIEQVVNK